MALIATTSSGGENGLAARAFPLLEAGQTLLEKALTPLGYDLNRRGQTSSNLLVLEALSSHENDAGADYIAIRCCIPALDSL
jgi:hypothetical protein